MVTKARREQAHHCAANAEACPGAFRALKDRQAYELKSITYHFDVYRAPMFARRGLP